MKSSNDSWVGVTKSGNKSQTSYAVMFDENEGDEDTYHTVTSMMIQVLWIKYWGWTYTLTHVHWKKTLA